MRNGLPDKKIKYPQDPDLCPNHRQICQKDTCVKRHKYLIDMGVKKTGVFSTRVSKKRVSKRQVCQKDGGVIKTWVSKRQGCLKDKIVEKIRGYQMFG